MTEPSGDNTVPKLQAEIARLKDENNKLRASNRRWMRIAGTDSHTGLPNKVFFTTAMLPQAISTANAEGLPLGCVMMAPDNLGEHNAKYGRKGGDQIVEGVANFLSDNVEEEEKLVHLDGANFILLVPNGDVTRVKRRSLTLRARVMNRQFECGSDQISLTLSFGVVSRKPTPEGAKVVVKELVEDFLRRHRRPRRPVRHVGRDRPGREREHGEEVRLLALPGGLWRGVRRWLRPRRVRVPEANAPPGVRDDGRLRDDERQQQRRLTDRA